MQPRIYTRPAVTACIISATLVVGAPGLAVAAGKPRAKVDRLERTIDRLDRRVDRYRSRLAAARRNLAVRTAERDAAQRQVAAITEERDRATSDLAGLRQQIAATPSPLQAAVRQIQREVEYTATVLDRAGVTYPRDGLVAHAAMSYVVGHVSAPAYGWMNELAGSRPAPTADGVLGAGAGICGHAALTFAAIVKQFGLTVRSVQFYYGDTDNHIASEVWYDGAWHYYDPTFGAYYKEGSRVLSMEEARAHPHPKSLLEFDETLFWYEVASTAGLESLTDLGVETAPGTVVEYDKQPFTD